MEKLKFNYVLSDNQNKQLKDLLYKVKNDPYVYVNNFKEEINELINGNKVPLWFKEICEEWALMDKFLNPEFLISNAPIDTDIPILPFKNPVKGKYRLKKTFISESFLELFAQMCHQISIGYKYVNTGDIYQDIHPWQRLKESQSQKSIVNLGFHKDLANHFVRPDYVNILALRNSNANKVYTTYVKNKELLEEFDKLGITDILKEELFFTPYDALTKDGDNKDELGKAKKHSIIYEETNISFFEGRTEGLSKHHIEAVNLVVKSLHKLKRGIHFKAGDFISNENNKSIHGKEIIEINNESHLKERWLMKTVNLTKESFDSHKKFFFEDDQYIVNG